MNSLKIITISDTHGSHELLNLPAGDMVIHAGDVSARSTLWETVAFLDWFGRLPYFYKILVPSNHDWSMVNNIDILSKMCKENNIHLLIDSGCKIEGIKIWGSPNTPKFCNWAFNKSCTVEESLKPESIARGHDFIGKYWELIPVDTDILVTHGPPHGILDEIQEYNDKGKPINRHVGCHLLADKVEQIKPKFHIFGHMHQGYGIRKIKDSIYINASCLDKEYNLVNNGHTIDYK
jgi:hypothetical protein